MYLQRVNSKGMQGNRYWYAKAFNRGAGTVNALPNCTTFCIGEIWEETFAQLATKLFNIPYQNPGAFPNAKDWYAYWIGKKGVEPKTGGVAVWGSSKTNPNGHVAIVLDTIDEGTKGTRIKVCQSNYKGKYFEVKDYLVRKNQTTEGVGCPYLGCCYVDIDDIRTSRDENVFQVEVVADALNVRNKPNGVVYSGRRCPMGVYNVPGTKEEGGYVWAELQKDFWIALNDGAGWTKTYESTFERRYEALKKAYDELLAKYEALLKGY